MRKYLFLLLLIPMFSLEAAAPPHNQYAFSQNIDPQFFDNKWVNVPLSEHVIRYNDVDFSQLQLVNNRNEPVPFELFNIHFDIEKNIKKVTTNTSENASKANNFMEFLVDDDHNTFYKFDRTVDKTNPARLFIEFENPINLHQVSIYNALRSHIAGYQIRSGLTETNLQIIKRKSIFQKHTNISPRMAKFLEINLWGNNIKVSEFDVHRRSQAAINFVYEKDQNYRILYGNPLLKSKRYIKRSRSPRKNVPTLTVQKHEINPFFVEDFDEDQVPNDKDNCIFVANSKQKDQDQDFVGDLCDNAIKTKNIDQSDVDRDNVGDIIDNCKTEFNPKQKDRDNNGIGNECETIILLSDNDSLSDFFKKNIVYLFIGIIGVILFVLYSNYSKQKK